MQILGWDELTSDQRGQVALIDWSDWNAPSVSGLLHERWLHGRPYQEYLLPGRGGGRAGPGTRRHRPGLVPGPVGAERVLGVGDVITNPRDLRHGLATRLMAEVHSRARSDGLRLSFLTTRVSWAAHRAYEKLGYRDVYSAGRALRWVPRSPAVALPRGFSARRGRRSDASALRQSWRRRASGGSVYCLAPRGGSRRGSGSTGTGPPIISSFDGMGYRSGTRCYPAVSGSSAARRRYPESLSLDLRS